MATTWMTTDVNACLDVAVVCASPPPPELGATITARIITTSAETTTIRGAARSMDATGPALITNQLQVGWQEWTWKLSSHVL